MFACSKGFEDCLEKGPLIGHRVLGVHMLINDGQTHVVDSSELAFRTATHGAFKQAFLNAQSFWSQSCRLKSLHQMNSKVVLSD